MRDGGDGVDIGDIGIGIAKRFQIDGLRVFLNGVFYLSKIMRIDKCGGHAELHERVRQQVVAATVDGLLRDNVIAGLRQRLNGVADGCCAGGNGQRRNTAFQRGYTLFQHVLRGIGEPAVDVAGVGEAKARRSMGAVAENIGSRLVNGHRAGIGGGVGLFLTDVKLQGLKFVVTHINTSF